MTDQEIADNLRESIKNLEQLYATTGTRIAQLKTALDALEGKLPVASYSNGNGETQKRGPSVCDMCEKAVDQMGDKVVFDHRSLSEMACMLFPDADAKHVRRGVYSAVNWLRKHNRIEKCPGGFCRIVAKPLPTHS